MTQVEMTNKALDMVADLMPDKVHSESNELKEIENCILAVIAKNLAAIADELKEERE